MKPDTADVAVIGTLTARVPGWRTAAMKPRVPANTSLPSVIGSPAAMAPRTTAPTKSDSGRLPSTMYVGARLPCGQDCQRMSSGLTIWPVWIALRATRTCNVGAATGAS